MTNDIPLEWLAKNRACRDALEWLRTQPDMQMAWAHGVRSDWMLGLGDAAALEWQADALREIIPIVPMPEIETA